MQVLSVENVGFAICKMSKCQNVNCLNQKLLGGGDIRGIDRRSFILRNQPRLLFFPPPFTTVCLFVVLGMGVHRVFHRFLVRVEKDVLESKRSQYLFIYFFFFFFGRRRGD